MLASLRTNHIEWVLAKFLLSWKCMWHVWWGIQSVPSDLPALGGVSLTGSLTLTPTARDQSLERIQCQWGWLGLQALLYPPNGGQGGNVLELRLLPLHSSHQWERRAHCMVLLTPRKEGCFNCFLSWDWPAQPGCTSLLTTLGVRSKCKINQ